MVTAKSLWANYLKRHWKIYLAGTLMVLVVDLLQVSSVNLLGWIVDLLTQENTPEGTSKEQRFVLLFALLVGARVLIALGRYGWRRTLARQTHVAGNELRRKIWDHARYFFLHDVHKRFSKGVLLNNSNSDVGQSRFLFGFAFVGAVDILFMGIFAFASMCAINITMACWVLGVLTILPLVNFPLSRLQDKRYRASQKSLSQLDNMAGQAVSTVRMQKLAQTGKVWQQRLGQMATTYREKRVKTSLTNILYIPFFDGVTLLSFVVLFALGISYVINGQMTIGEFVAMEGLIFLLRGPLEMLGELLADGKQMAISLERLAEVYNNPLDKGLAKEGQLVRPENPVLKVENLSFQFDGTKRKLIDNLSLELRQRERLGILGPIGQGKTTLLRILAGLERNIQGKVSLYGKDLSYYDPWHLRHHLGIVSQRPFIFAGSVRENVALDFPLEDDEIWEALALAQIAQEVRDLPDGLETELGEWGVNLSGGQKQRLSLARILTRRPPLLFFDDCLSAVDTVTEEMILEGLDRELPDTTLIWVAHRKSTLKYCHRLLEWNPT